MSTVLVTGGSGFVGGHLLLRLLADGHAVRTTVRHEGRGDAVRAMLRNGGQEPGDRLEFFEADLLADGGWDRAVAGCDFVHHVASPLPLRVPRDEDELIAPAREGTLRLLRAARDAGVRRVVVTSSFAAIGYGHGRTDRVFTEEDWTDPAGADVQPYVRSKTLAERAAWDFIAREGAGLELSVVNPVAIFGPILGPGLSSSIEVVRRLLDGLPAFPRVSFGVVDVRDVADLHVRAMTEAAACGQRFLAVDRTVSLRDATLLLRARLGEAGRRVPAHQAPDWLLRVLAPFSREARAIVPHLGAIRQGSSAKARRLLGWQPRPWAETIVATAESLIRFGLVRI